MQTVQVIPLVGRPQALGWSQVVNDPDRHLVWAVAVSGEHARNVGRDLLDTLHTFNPNSAAQLYQNISDLVYEVKNKDCSISVVAGLLLPNDSTERGMKCVWCSWRGNVFLQRQGKFGSVLQAEKPDIQIVEGRFQASEDIFVLTTEEGAQFANDISIKFKQGINADQTIRTLEKSMHLAPESALSAMALLQVVEVTEETEPVPEPVTPVLEDSFAELEPEDVVVTEKVVPAVETEPEYQDEEINEEAEIVVDQVPPVSNGALNEASSPVMMAQRNIEDDVPDSVTVSTAEVMEAMSASSKKAGSALKKASKNSAKIAGKFGSYLWKQLSTIRWRSLIPRLISREVYVSTSWRRKAVRVLIALVALAVLAGLGFFGWQYRQQQVQAQVSAELEPIQAQVTSAQEKVDSEPISAREETKQAIEALEGLVASSPNRSIRHAILSRELSQVQAFYETISGKEEVIDLPVFADFSEQDAQFVTTDMVFLNEQIIAVDSSSGQVMTLDPSDASITAQTFEELSDVRDLAARAETSQVWGIVGDQLKQIRPLRQDDAITTLVTDDTVLPDAKFVSAFAQAAYVLHPTDRMIYRYDISEDEADSATKWLRSAPGVDFETITSMVIDGEIWLADSRGNIFNLRSGQQQEFTISGLEQPFTSSLQLFTTSDSDFLYVLEADQNRIVQLNKNGTFEKEITSPALASSVGIVVVEAIEQVFAVSGSVVYALSV